MKKKTQPKRKSTHAKSILRLPDLEVAKAAVEASAAAANPRQRVFHFRAITSPPKDYSQWSTLVREFAKHLIDRYGRSEVQYWYFEVWNEPDLHMPFFQNEVTDSIDTPPIKTAAPSSASIYVHRPGRPRARAHIEYRSRHAVSCSHAASLR
jgi:hypothetical protein